jgi:hypothetical protein
MPAGLQLLIMDTTTIYIVFSVCVLVDLLLLAIMPRFYVRIGIPLFIKKTVINDTGVLAARKGMLSSAFEQNKFFDNGTDIWFRTKFSVKILYSLAILSVTKGIFHRKGDTIYCYHVMNVTTLLFIILLAVLPLYYPIDALGMGILALVALALIVFALLRNSQFKEMLEMLYPKPVPLAGSPGSVNQYQK